MECRTDDWNIDICCTGSQKALMLPPGLAFVSVSDKAWKAIDKNPTRATFYFDLKKARKKPGDQRHAVHAGPHADPGHARQPEEDPAPRGSRTSGPGRRATPPPPGPASRRWAWSCSPTPPNDGLTVVKMPAGIDGTALLDKLEKQYGLKLANGQDTLKGKIIRLAHMGYIDQFDVLAAIAGVELVLLEMGHPIEPGGGRGGAAVLARSECRSCGLKRIRC